VLGTTSKRPTTPAEGERVWARANREGGMPPNATPLHPPEQPPDGQPDIYFDSRVKTVAGVWEEWYTCSEIMNRPLRAFYVDAGNTTDWIVKSGWSTRAHNAQRGYWYQRRYKIFVALAAMVGVGVDEVLSLGPPPRQPPPEPIVIHRLRVKVLHAVRELDRMQQEFGVKRGLKAFSEELQGYRKAKQKMWAEHA
jgi:hypothetical protein